MSRAASRLSEADEEVQFLMAEVSTVILVYYSFEGCDSVLNVSFCCL